LAAGYEVHPEKPLIDAGVDSLAMVDLGQAVEADVVGPAGNGSGCPSTHFKPSIVESNTSQ